MYMKIIIILMHISHSMKTFQFRWNIGLYIKLKTIKLVRKTYFLDLKGFFLDKLQKNIILRKKMVS